MASTARSFALAVRAGDLLRRRKCAGPLELRLFSRCFFLSLLACLAHIRDCICCLSLPLGSLLGSWRCLSLCCLSKMFEWMMNCSQSDSLRCESAWRVSALLTPDISSPCCCMSSEMLFCCLCKVRSECVLVWGRQGRWGYKAPSTEYHWG